ncbi:hypothetical protein FTO74_10715 [Granulicella sp. WH15]|uniref:hypothetical protein n=1 Tax=Granulicella sp. WH15 TaxID=2602070 RepID=UPI0013679884|nr:hypothetical protein [Granulicella sp. WH15]QHN03793.1 hypothetical protein FTO74_10715 [Granulicella sp. WH15]
MSERKNAWIYASALRRQTNRRNVLIVTLLSTIFSSTASSNAQSPTGACQATDYKILTNGALAVKCLHSVTVAGRTASIGPPPPATGAATVFEVDIITVDSSWLLITPSAAAGPFSFVPTQKYALTLTYLAPDAQNPANLVATAETPLVLDFSNTFTVRGSKISTQPQHFIFESHIGLTDSGGSLLQQANPGDVPHPNQACSLLLENTSQRDVSVGGHCYELKPVSKLSVAAMQNIDPQWVGRIDVDLVGVSLLKSTLIPMGLPSGAAKYSNVFGIGPKIDPKSRISAQKAPATKDASAYYFNVNYAAGTGTAPGWELDGKVAPVLAMRDGFTIGPSATANVGGNKVPGQTYTDSIDLGGTVQRYFQPGISSKKPAKNQSKFRRRLSLVLPLLALNGTVTYETDKEFDRDNLIGAATVKYYFAHSNNTQSIQTLRNFYKKIAPLSDGDAAKVQLADIRVPPFGYEFDFHTGIEAGRAIRDKTVTATSGKASLVLPEYSIFRIVPQVHSILQFWKISTETTVVGRYLVATENTILQTKSNALHLEHLQTWRALCTATATYSDSSASHVGLTIKYTNGFDAPTYARVNSIQAGLLIKY